VVPKPSSSAERSTPSERRISSEAWRPTASMEASASAAPAGSRARTRRAAPAWITITLMLWATTSWSSRAMRVRSWVAAARASEARLRSRRSASLLQLGHVRPAGAQVVAQDPRRPEHEVVGGEVAEGDVDRRESTATATPTAAKAAPTTESRREAWAATE
jgi:hypothetical protein